VSRPFLYGKSSPNFAQRTSSDAKQELRSSSSRTPTIFNDCVSGVHNS
jgi:hypothetical protein